MPKQKTNDEAEIMTMQEVATMLRLKRGAVHRLIREKDFPHIRFSWKFLFRKSDVLDWIEKQIVRPNGKARR
jgi:excisionase family DNA binding protein